MRRTNTRRALLMAAGALMAFPAEAARGDFPDIAYATWNDDEPGYRLYPGDEIEVATPTAPELTRSLKVGPDGRVSLPLAGHLMVADRTLTEVEADASRAYAASLLRPQVEVTLKQAGAQRVLVGGEVNTPGWVDMPGDIDALQAVMAAGGFKPGAKMQSVVIIRRNAASQPMRRVVDLSRALKDPTRADAAPLRRFDIVYVPRSSLAEAGRFMTQVRDLLPFSFSYSINNPYQQ